MLDLLPVKICWNCRRQRQEGEVEKLAHGTPTSPQKMMTDDFPKRQASEGGGAVVEPGATADAYEDMFLAHSLRGALDDSFFDKQFERAFDDFDDYNDDKYDHFNDYEGDFEYHNGLFDIE